MAVPTSVSPANSVTVLPAGHPSPEATAPPPGSADGRSRLSAPTGGEAGGGCNAWLGLPDGGLVGVVGVSGVSGVGVGVAVWVVITETGLMSTPSSSSTARTVTAWVPAPLNTCVTEQVPATAGTVVPVPSRQSNVQVWVSFAPGSVTVAVKSIALPASTVVLSAGELMVATGGALVTASGAVAVTGALMPSSPVRVRVKVPSSVQVTVVVSELGSAKVQVAPG